MNELSPITIEADAQPSNALATIETTNFALVFVPGGVDAILERIKRDARAEAAKLDISTPKSREAILALKRKVVRSRTTMDAAGKDLKAEWLARSNAIDADRRKARTELEALEAEIEAPVVAFEKIKADLLKANEDAIATIESLADRLGDLNSAEIMERSRQLAIVAEFNWSPEFIARAERVQNGAIAQLDVAFRAAKQREADAAAEMVRAAQEAERNRLAAIQAQQERDAQIAAEAAAEATRLAEAAFALRAKEAAAAARRAEEEAKRAAQRADYHRSMLQHVKDCGFGFIGGAPQSSGILQYELTTKIKFDAENFGDLLEDALAAKDEALKLIRRAIDAGERRRAAEEEALATKAALEAAAVRERQAAEVAARLVAQAETKRTDTHKAALAVMQRLAVPLTHPDSLAVIDTKLERLADVSSAEWEEFADEAAEIYAASKAALSAQRGAAIQAETLAAAERAKVIADRAEITRKADAAQAERNLAEQLAAERKRVADEEAAALAAAEKRSADVSHQRRINREAVDALMSYGMSEPTARTAVEAIAREKVPHIRISY